MADTSGVIGALRTNTAEITEAKNKLIDINSAMQKELATQAELTSQGTTISSRGVRTTPLAIKQELMADLAAQNANQIRAQTVDFENTSNELLATIKAQGAKRKEHLDEIQQINEGSILEQVVGMFTIPGIAIKAEVAGEQQKVAADTLMQVNQAMQTSAKTTAEIQTRVTEGTIASLSSAIAADTAKDAAEIRAKAIATSADLILKTTALSGQALDNKVKEYTIGVQEEQRQFMNEQRIQMRKNQEKEIKEGKISEQALDSINLALVANGKQPIPEGQRELVKDQLNKSGPLGESYRELLFQGSTIMTSGGKVVQGATPTDAAEFRQKINYEPQTQEEARTLSIIQSQFTSKSVQDATSKIDKIAAANKAVLDKLKADQENINTSADSLAKPATWATLATSKAITDQRAWTEVIAPTITDNISTNYVEPADLYKRIIAGVTTNKMTIAEGSRLYTTYAKYSMEMNNNASGLEKLTGFKQTAFTARLPQPASGIKGFLAKAGELQVGFLGAPIALGIKATTGLDATARLGPPLAGTSSRFVNGLDQVDVSNAMASSIAGELRKVTQ